MGNSMRLKKPKKTGFSARRIYRGRFKIFVTFNKRMYLRGANSRCDLGFARHLAVVVDSVHTAVCTAQCAEIGNDVAQPCGCCNANVSKSGVGFLAALGDTHQPDQPGAEEPDGGRDGNSSQ